MLKKFVFVPERREDTCDGCYFNTNETVKAACDRCNEKGGEGIFALPEELEEIEIDV